MKQDIPYTTQTFTIPFYQSGKISRLIWRAHFQTDWCYNEGVRQALEAKPTQYDMFSKLKEKRDDRDWLDLNVCVHRAAIDNGRKAVEAFRASNAEKRWRPKHKRKYTSPDSLFRKREDGKRQAAIGCYARPARNKDGSWNLGGICSIVPKTTAIKQEQIKSFQIVETTRKITRRTKPEDRTYEMHVQIHVAKPTRRDGDIIGIDVGAVNMMAVHNLDNNESILLTLPENATRYKGDETDRRKSAQSKRKKGSNSWKKEQERIRKKNAKTINRRTDFMRKSVKENLAGAEIIAVENLHPKQMARKGRGKTGLNRTIMHAALGEVLSYIEWFAKKHNKEFHRVKPHYTSTTCADCGHSDRNSRRSQSIFICVRCGHEDHADMNAAVNVSARGAKAAGKVVVRRKKEHTVPRACMRERIAVHERANQRASLPSEKDKNGHGTPSAAAVYYCI